MRPASDELIRGERLALLNQKVSEITLLVTREAPASPEVRVLYDILDRPERRTAAAKFPSIEAWLAARRAGVEGDVSGFLHQATRFFDGGLGCLRLGWREMTLALGDVCKCIAPEEVESLVV